MTCGQASNEIRSVPSTRPTDREVVPGSIWAQTRDNSLQNTVSSTAQLSSASTGEPAKTK